MLHAFAPQQKFNTVDYNLEQEAKTNLDYLKGTSKNGVFFKTGASQSYKQPVLTDA